ncbi:MAG: GNAT family N-acetyltransferase [Chloroflexi bacterium]|nr:GNAT family N-acetyltransferase [Chloroflexota bacterium]
MRLEPLTLDDANDWAALLAAAFDRTPADMLRLLGWLHESHRVIAWGAWIDDRLAAQYACLMRTVALPDGGLIQVGMSVNMAVHPDYRGRGLIKQIARPVYQDVALLGGVAGVGFSNAAGVQVDRRSTGYGYRVCGRMIPAAAWIPLRRSAPALELTESLDALHDSSAADLFPNSGAIHFAQSSESLLNRYCRHPFRRYHFGVWREDGRLCGVVVYRPVQLLGLPAAALLGAYGVDLPALLRRWMAALHAAGTRVVHLLASERSALRTALAAGAPVVALPRPRTPYYLTVKPLSESVPLALFDFAAWDCAGGDVL